MTDQPHTPYIEDGWLVEPCEPDYAPGISQPIPGSWSKPIVDLAELDGYDELIAAAEQRGAIKALRGAAHSPRLADAVQYAIKHDSYAGAARRSFENYLLQEANRAEQMEGDDA